MRHLFIADDTRRGHPELYKILRLLHHNPAQRRQFDFPTESDCRRRGILALIRRQYFYLRKREQRLVPVGRETWEREVASCYLHSYLAASLSRFFPAPTVIGIEMNV